MLKLSVVIGLCLSVFSSMSMASEPMKRVASSVTQSSLPARIVVKQKPSVMAQAQSLTAFGQVVKTNGDYKSIQVPADEAESILNQLRQRDDVESAEMDYVVSVPNPVQDSSQVATMMEGYQTTLPSSVSMPNDVYYGSQYYWREQTASLPGQSSIALAQSLTEQRQKPLVAVLDGGFVNATDLNYAGGYNFSMVDSQSRNDNYLKDQTGCTVLHGTAVTGIIGAITDNGTGMAGMVDADIYAGRVLACNSGYLSDAADGIRWAANDPNLSATPLPRPADVINLSLSGKTGSCPSYMQSAINYAVSRGSTVVVAAGNDNVDASEYSPANCNNVITVGAISRDGYKAGFSNFGNKIDVSAMGVSVMTLQGTDGLGYWNGTSFSSPLTAGLVAMLKQKYPSLSPATVESLLKSTAGGFATPYANMGQGIVNAEQMMIKANDLYGSKTASMQPAMKSGERCQTGYYTNVFGDRLTKLCKLYEVDASNYFAVGSQSYVVFKVPSGQTLSASNPNATVAGYGTDAKFLVGDVDATNYDYGLQVCDATGVNCKADALYDLKASKVAKPSLCDGY